MRPRAKIAYRCVKKAPPRISSFEKNPENGGSPEIATVAISIVSHVDGRRRASPPIFRRSCSPASAWMTEPAPRKRSALKKAWVTRWKMPAAYAPTPTPTNM
jgi:hypothetical protein